MGRTPLIFELRRLLKVTRALGASPKTEIEEYLERREFLKRTGQLAAVIFPAAHLLSSCAHVPRRTYSKDDPVMIISGGMAGLSAAFYLTQANVPCEIFEASGRVGGRMMSRLNFNSEG